MSKKENFKRVLLCALLLIVSIIGTSAYSQTSIYNISKTEKNVITAIIQLESKGKTHVVNGTCCGPLQISPSMVKACNKIAKEMGLNIKFTMQDRFNLDKSKKMFIIFNKKFNPNFNVEKAIRSWNGGPKYSVSRTQKYYSKVMSYYRKL